MTGQDQPDGDIAPKQPTSTPGDARSGVRPDKAAAAARAEEIVYRRDHPAVQTERPRTVIAGCAMTWVGAVAMGVYSILALSITEDSSVFSADLTQSEIDTGVRAYHDLGVVFAVWGVLLAVFTVFAYLRRRWAATVLFVMALIVSVVMFVTLFTTFAIGGLVTAVYSLCAALLVRRSERSRNWYDARPRGDGATA